MRLWHEKIIHLLPKNQLLGQHRECCALRGNGWKKKHKTVNYVFSYSPYHLFIYHVLVMKESKKDFRNAILHIWGYFKKKASTIEKEALFNILNEYMEGKNNQNAVIEYINTLLKKYPNEYLEKSILLTGEKYETMA